MAKKQEFPSMNDIKRLSEVRKWQRLYQGDHYKEYGIKDYFVDSQEKEELLYIAVNLTALISDYYADMVSGDNIEITSKDQDEQKFYDEFKLNNNLNEKAYQIALDQSIAGYSAIKVWSDENKNVYLDIEQPDQYFPNYSKVNGYGNPLEVTLASYITLINSKGKEQRYLFKEIYEVINDKVQITWEVWKVDSKLEITERISVEDPIFEEIKGDSIEFQQTDLTSIPINQIDNTKTSRNDFGKSDYKDLSNLIQEINDRLTQISVQLIKHLNAKIAVPEGVLDEDGNVKVSGLDAIQFSDQGQIPQYITNSNPQIENGFKQIEVLIRMVAALSKVPSDLLGLPDKGGAEKVEAIKIRLFNTTRKIERKRMQLTSQLQKSLMTAYELSTGGKKKATLPTITYTDILPVDDLINTNIVIQKYNSGLISKETAIKSLEELSQEGVEIELDKINRDLADRALFTPNRVVTGI